MNDKAIVISETTTARIKKSCCNRGTPMVRSIEKKIMQIKITHTCSIDKGILYLISEISKWNTNTRNHYDETKPNAKCRSETRTQENHKQDHNGPDQRHSLSSANQAEFTLRKHAYSNIYKISPPKTENFQIKKKKNSDIFHISAQNIDCGYSLEQIYWQIYWKFYHQKMKLQIKNSEK